MWLYGMTDLEYGRRYQRLKRAEARGAILTEEQLAAPCYEPRTICKCGVPLTAKNRTFGSDGGKTGLCLTCQRDYWREAQRKHRARTRNTMGAIN